MAPATAYPCAAWSEAPRQVSRSIRSASAGPGAGRLERVERVERAPEMLGRLQEGGALERPQAGGVPVVLGPDVLGGANEVTRHHLRLAVSHRWEPLGQDRRHIAVQRLTSPAQDPVVRGLLEQRVGEFAPGRLAVDRPQHVLDRQLGQRRSQVRSIGRPQGGEQFAVELPPEHRGHVDHLAQRRQPVQPLGEQAAQGRGHRADALDGAPGIAATRVLEHLQRLLHEQRNAVGGLLDPVKDGRRQRLGGRPRGQRTHVLGAERIQLDLGHRRRSSPRRRELGPEGQDAQGRHAGETGDDPAQQLDGRRVGPVQVLDHEEQGLARRVGDQQRLEHVQRGGANVARGQRRPVAFGRSLDGEQIGQQRYRLDRVQAGLDHGVADGGQLVVGRLGAVQRQQPLQVADDRVQDGPAMMARALPGLGVAGVGTEPIQQLAHDPALADPGLAAQMHDRAVGPPGLLPCLGQPRQLAVAAHQRRQAPLAGDLQPGDRAGRTDHPVHADRTRHPLQRLGAERLEHEEPVHQVARGVADDDRGRRGDRLQPRGDMRRLAHDRQRLARRPRTHLAGDDQAGVDADPDPQGDAMPARQLLVERAQPGEDAQPGVDRPPGTVLLGAGIAEVRQQTVAGPLGGVTAELLDGRAAGLAIAGQDIAEVLGVQRLRQRCGPHDVAEHQRQMAAMHGARPTIGRLAGRCPGEGGATGAAELHARRALAPAVLTPHPARRPHKQPMFTPEGYRPGTPRKWVGDAR
ncbi:MAG TPA: hypothetical protein VHX62_17455 [Solirubrobacteraceae bacterium]|nr:hypothetical protein [Solirubrobacteraceae bacterium]